MLAFYDPGGGPGGPGGGVANPHVPLAQRDPLFPGLVTDPLAIIAFLQSLSASSYDRSVPATVPSGLPVDGNIQ